MIGAIISGFMAGVLIPIGRAKGQNWASFKWAIFWKENQARLIYGVLTSIAAVVATMSLTPESIKEMPDVYNGLLFVAAASPVTVLSFLIKKNEPKIR